MTASLSFPFFLPALPAFLGGFLLVLLRAGVEAEIAGAYGQAVSLYAGFNFFLLLSALAGCYLARAQLLLLDLRRGRYLCGVLLLLPLLLSRLPVPASPWGTNAFWDCFVKCLVFYGLTFAVLAAAPVLLSELETIAPAAGKNSAPGPEARQARGSSMRFFGAFCLGAGAAAALLSSPAAWLAGQRTWTGLYLVFAAAAVASLSRPAGPPPQAPDESGDLEAVLTGAGIALWFVASEYVLFLVGGPETGTAAQYLFFFAFAANFIPALRRRPVQVVLAGAVLCALTGIRSSSGLLPFLFFLLMLHWGGRIYSLRPEAPGSGRLFVMLGLGALGGALLGGAGIVWAHSRAASAGVAAYSVMLPLMCAWLALMWRGRVVYETVTKYGKYRVVDKLMGSRVLLNKYVNHGGQLLEAPDGTSRPASYYSPASPAGELLARHSFGRVAMLGLGTGAMCFYAKEGSWWTVYELDLEVARIARTYFSAIKQCKGRLNFVMGDAGKTLEKALDSEFDLLLVDVYTGKEIPGHMVSKEAFGLYRAKLKKDGALLVHATGHAAELEARLGAHCSGAGVELLGKSGYCPLDWGCAHSYWLLAASDPALLKELRELRWRDVKGR